MNGNFDLVCNECVDGYFLTEDGVCASCDSSPLLKDCSECSNAFTCTSCVIKEAVIENLVFEY